MPTKPRLLLVALIVVIAAPLLWLFAIKFAAAEDVMRAVLLVVLVAAVITVPRWMQRRKQNAQVGAIVSETRRWFSDINQLHALTVCFPRRIMLRAEEFAVLAKEADLLEPVDPNARYYLGSDIRIGKLPIYVGASASTSKDWQLTDHGEMVISNDRLIFVGYHKQIEVPWISLLAVKPLADGVLVSATLRTASFVLTAHNGLLCAEICRFMARSKRRSAKIPHQVYTAPTWEKGTLYQG